jgi:hypothetical protein
MHTITGRNLVGHRGEGKGNYVVEFGVVGYSSHSLKIMMKNGQNPVQSYAKLFGAKQPFLGGTKDVNISRKRNGEEKVGKKMWKFEGNF